MNDPVRKPWLPIAAALCALAAILVFVWAVGPDHESARTLPSELDSAEKPAERMAAATLPERSAIRSDAPGGAEPTVESATVVKPAVATRRESLWLALQELERVAEGFPPRASTPAFDDVDMEPVRRTIVRLHVTGAELRDLLDDVDPDKRHLRPLVLASFAYAAEVSERDQDVVLDASRIAFANPESLWNVVDSHLRAAESFSGLFALQMLEAQPRMREAASHFLALHALESRERNQYSRDLSAFALNSLEGELDGESRAEARRLIEGEGEHSLTAAAWGALGRGGTAEDRAWLAEQALSGRPMARFGMERIRDPAAIGMLEPIALSKVRPKSGSHAASSAALGLLSIGTPQALDAFRNLVRTENGVLSDAALHAIEQDPPLESVGVLLELSSTPVVPGKLFAIDLQIEQSIVAIRDRLGRSTVPPSTRVACVRAVQQSLPGLTANPKSLRRAFEVLAIAGDEATWNELAPERALLSRDDVAALEALRADRR